VRKVGWIASRFFPESIGGAEETDYALMEQGRKQGYLIEQVQNKPKPGTYDYLILSNFHDWSPEKALRIVENEKYAVFRHDVFKLGDALDLLKNSFCNVFMSPLQYEFYKSKLYMHNNTFMTPCAFNTFDSYHSSEKKDHFVYVGDVAIHKGILNIAQYAVEHPDKTFYAYGNIYGDFNLPSNLKLMGFVRPERIPKILAESKFFIHLPEIIDTCPRVDVAAYLSGCELIYNSNVGLFSWPWKWTEMDFKKLKEILTEHKEKFWETLDSFFVKT